MIIEHPHVELDEHGFPRIKGTRVPVQRLWQWHIRGVRFEALFQRYPMLSRGVILDAVAFAYDNIELIELAIARERTELSIAEERGVESIADERARSAAQAALRGLSANMQAISDGLLSRLTPKEREIIRKRLGPKDEDPK